MKLAELALAKSSIRHAAAPWGAVTSVSGFLADVLKPAGSLAPYLLGASVVGTLCAVFLFRKKVKQEGLEPAFNSTVGGFLAFFFLSTLAWVALTVVFARGPQEGFAASEVAAIADFQKNVLKLGQNVEETKQVLDRVENKLDRLKKSEMLIDKPQSAEDFYHNAQVYQKKGFMAEAQESYENCLKMGPQFWDVHQEYQLIAEERERKKNFYERLVSQFPQDFFLQLVSIQALKFSNERLSAIQALSKTANIPPVLFELVRLSVDAAESSEDGERSVLIQQSQKALKQLQQFEESQLKFYFLTEEGYQAFHQRFVIYEKKVKALTQAAESLPESTSTNSL